MTVRSKAMIWLGWALSVAVTLYLLRDVSYDLTQNPLAVKANASLGIPARVVLPIGIVGLVCTLLYALPQTAVLGAILLGGFLGGAVFTHMRVGGDIAWDVGENVLIGVVAWGGLWLRDARVRALLPVRRATRGQR